MVGSTQRKLILTPAEDTSTEVPPITYEELKEGLAKLGSKLTETEVKHLMDAASCGSIDYIEFIIATMPTQSKPSSILTKTAADKLEAVLKEYKMGDNATIKEVLLDVESDNGGRINYEEFCAMVRSANPQQPLLF